MQFLSDLTRWKPSAIPTRWVRRGTLAIIDQGVFSGANFIVSILLARWMSESDYGAYAYTFAIFLLISGFYNVLFLEPMSIFGPVRHARHFMGYLRQVMGLHALSAAISTVGLMALWGAVTLIRSDRWLFDAFVGMSLGHGLTLFFWLLRRACYARHQPGKALAGTLVYASALIGGLGLLASAERLTLFGAFVWMGMAGVMGGAFQYAILRPDSVPRNAAPAVTPRELIRENWGYGRWMLIASAFSWLSMWAYFVIAGSLLDLEEIAGLKAIQNIVMPMTQAVTAFTLLFAPWASERFALQGMEALKDGMRAFSTLLALLCLLYFVPVWVFRDTLMDWLYGGKFALSVWILLFFLLQLFVTAVTASWYYGLRIIARTRDVMILYVIGGATTLAVGTPLIVVWELQGAVAGIVLSSLTPLPVLVSLWNKAEIRQ
jgi:O-antigen/teichoic acid export membrane protein